MPDLACSWLLSSSFSHIQGPDDPSDRSETGSVLSPQELSLLNELKRLRTVPRFTLTWPSLASSSQKMDFDLES